MNTLYIIIALIVFNVIFFAGYILCARLSEDTLLQEKMKSHDEGWRAGYDLGYGEGLNEIDEDPMMEYRDEELGMMRFKH